MMFEKENDTIPDWLNELEKRLYLDIPAEINREFQKRYADLSIAPAALDKVEALLLTYFSQSIKRIAEAPVRKRELMFAIFQTRLEIVRDYVHERNLVLFAPGIVEHGLSAPVNAIRKFDDEIAPISGRNVPPSRSEARKESAQAHKRTRTQGHNEPYAPVTYAPVPSAAKPSVRSEARSGLKKFVTYTAYGSFIFTGMVLLSYFLQWYISAGWPYPLLNAFLSMALSFLISDFISQKLTQAQAGPAKEKIKFSRLAYMSTIIGAYDAVLYHYWFRFFDLFGESIEAKITKVLLQETVFTLPYYFGFFLGVFVCSRFTEKGRAHGRFREEFVKYINSKFGPVYIKDLIFWWIIHSFSFFALPSLLGYIGIRPSLTNDIRISMVGFFSLVWLTYLSWISHSGNENDEKKRAEVREAVTGKTLIHEQPVYYKKRPAFFRRGGFLYQKLGLQYFERHAPTGHMSQEHPEWQRIMSDYLFNDRRTYEKKIKFAKFILSVASFSFLYHGILIVYFWMAERWFGVILNALFFVLIGFYPVLLSLTYLVRLHNVKAIREDAGKFLVQALKWKDFKLLVFDLDGSLAESNVAVREDILRLLAFLLQQDIHITIASAKHTEEILSRLGIEAIPVKWRKNIHIIAENGAVISDFNEAGDLVSSRIKTMEEKEKKEISEVILQVGKKFGLNEIPDSSNDKGFSVVEREASIVMGKLNHLTSSARNELAGRIEAALKKRSLAGRFHVEVTEGTVGVSPSNKADAVQYLRDKLKIPFSSIAVAGDSLNQRGNDRAMLLLPDVTPVYLGPERIRLASDRRRVLKTEKPRAEGAKQFLKMVVENIVVQQIDYYSHMLMKRMHGLSLQAQQGNIVAEGHHAVANEAKQFGETITLFEALEGL